MLRRSLPFIGVALVASLVLNFVLLAVLPGVRQAPSAFGQTSSEGGGFLLGTEKGADQAPICFVLRSDPPHLMVYRVDATGQLYLTASRKLQQDLRLEDHHFPTGKHWANTLPPVKVIEKGLPKEEEKGEKKAEKAAPAKTEPPGAEGSTDEK